EVREIASQIKARGQAAPAASGLDDAKLADRLKECLRVPLAIVIRRAGERSMREVRFLPQGPLTLREAEQAELVSPRLETLPSPPEQLPFWNARAARPPSLETDPAAATASAAVDALVARPGGPRTAAELELLRL